MLMLPKNIWYRIHYKSKPTYSPYLESYLLKAILSIPLTK